MELGIPDGEYELELSDVLQNQLGVSQDHNNGSSGPVRPIQRVNDEILSIRYGFRPDSIDDTQPAELTRDEKPSFQLKSQSTEHDQGIVFEGTSIQPKDLECILVFNPNSKSFELQKLDLQLRTNSIIKNRTLSNNNNLKKPTKDQSPQPSETKSLSPSTTSSTALRKRPAKEPSIFQPKPRAKTPLSKPPVSGKSSTSKTSSETQPTAKASDEDEVPLSKLTASKRSTVSKQSPKVNPSIKKPPSDSSTSPQKSTQNSSKISQKRTSPTPSVSPEKKSKPNVTKKSSTNSKLTEKKTISKSEPSTIHDTQNKAPTSRNTTPQPRSNSNNNTLKPLPNQVSSKKPPSTISTPTIQQESPSDDDEFGSLVDELEEELLSDDNFITIEDGSKDTSISTSGDKTYDFGVKNGNGPINFRHLAGMSSKDEDDLSSSSEEE